MSQHSIGEAFYPVPSELFDALKIVGSLPELRAVGIKCYSQVGGAVPIIQVATNYVSPAPSIPQRMVIFDGILGSQTNIVAAKLLDLSGNPIQPGSHEVRLRSNLFSVLFLQDGGQGLWTSSNAIDGNPLKNTDDSDTYEVSIDYEDSPDQRPAGTRRDIELRIRGNGVRFSNPP